MSNKNKNKLLPQLRFPEFINSGEWEEKLLNEISPAIFDGTHQTPSYTEQGIPFFSVENIISGNKNKFISKEDHIAATTKNKPEKGDIIITRIGNIGTSKVIDWDYEFSIYVTLAIVKKSNVFNSQYLHGYFQSNRYQREILSKSLLNAVPCKINMDELRETKVLLPPDKEKKEQQNIAACLSSLDDLITAENHKLEVLKTHKKGLMQNLFPGEGETVPKLRFKRFENEGEWVQTSVEDNCLVKGRIGYRGYTTQDLVGHGEGALVLGGKHIQNQMLELKDPTYLSWEKYYESPEIMVGVGDIIFSQRGTLGDCAIIDREIGPATINPSMVLLKNITCNARFLYYILIGDRIQIEVMKNMAMGAIPMLSQKQIKEFPFFIPKNPKEQQKIVDCLSSLDDLITKQSQKIEMLKLHKKGLMQNLFPSFNGENL